MPSDLPPRRRPTRRSRGRRRAQRGRVIVLVLLAVLVVLFLSARSLSGFYVDYLWYDALGRGDVFWRTLGAKASVVGVFTVGFAAFLFVNLLIADRLAPSEVPTGPEEQFIVRYRELVSGHHKLVRLGISALLGLFIGAPTIAAWQEWTLFRNAKSFGTSAAQLGGDAGFYVFRLPFLTYVIDWMFAALAMTALVIAAIHFVNGAIRVQPTPNVERITRGARVHLSLLFAALALVKTGDYWLQRFELTTSTRGAVHGATYTDVKAQLPAINLLMLVSLLVAVLFIVSTRRGGWRVPVLSMALWTVVAVIAGVIYPAMIQRFVVQPNVSTREVPYIAQNIEATSIGLDIGDVQRVTLPVSTLTDTEVETDQAPLRDTRLLDAPLMVDRFAQDRGLQPYYAIKDVDVDRYEVDGRLQQVMVAARELNPSGLPNQSWVSRHLIYTRGCGLVSAPAGRIDSDGLPVYDEVQVTRDEIYVGDGLGTYSVVDTDQEEQACVDETEAGEYEGDKAVRLDSTLRRLAFAVHFGEYNLFGSRLIGDDSQILYVRDVRDRVNKLAPFLHLDADPYPVAFDDRVVWVIDAFTTTSRFPNAQRADTSQLSSTSGLNHTFNYVRNSVKAVIDAYTGEVTLYVVDPDDPIIQAWQSAYPGLFTPGSEVPAELAEHFRYPEDLFRVQSTSYGRYRLSDPSEFFNRSTSWDVAQAPSDTPGQSTSDLDLDSPSTTVSSAQAQANSGDVRSLGIERFEPYYTMFHAPGQATADPVFSLLLPFVPFSPDSTKRELVSFMTVSSDPATFGQKTVYEIEASPLPRGPLGAAAQADRDSEISGDITLLNREGSKVIFGPLQIVPVADGLVYVRPLFLQSEATGEAAVKSVIAWYGDRPVMAPSLSGALRLLFPGADLQLGDVANGETPVDPGTGPGPDPGTDPGTGTETAAELLQRAQDLFDDAAAALEAQDLGLYQDTLAEAQDLVEQALALLEADAG